MVNYIYSEVKIDLFLPLYPLHVVLLTGHHRCCCIRPTSSFRRTKEKDHKTVRTSLPLNYLFIHIIHFPAPTFSPSALSDFFARNTTHTLNLQKSPVNMVVT